MAADLTDFYKTAFGLLKKLEIRNHVSTRYVGFCSDISENLTTYFIGIETVTTDEAEKLNLETWQISDNQIKITRQNGKSTSDNIVWKWHSKSENGETGEFHRINTSNTYKMTANMWSQAGKEPDDGIEITEYNPQWPLMTI
ncbi:hypothetical protein SMSP2_00813 [Limihaloglobus sulfuriphilus]|uniref:Uncharacterized protein n=1 Tax=Limihaloglobus sulfuriphilus TaxID=1851148 RepID=A0A1Q2MDX1_9BACT|nr:hypothetical protein [Limihaloglobus sulfuriphilus]AQQ70462.1 hypothetical protein SMSP2_00813 [Limihaloglobus sulfuriphilus]